MVQPGFLEYVIVLTRLCGSGIVKEDISPIKSQDPKWRTERLTLRREIASSASDSQRGDLSEGRLCRSSGALGNRVHS